MRTTLDITDDQSPGSPFGMPSGSNVCDIDDGVSISLSDVDLLMTFPQFVVFTDTLNAYRFRAPCGTIRMDEESDHLRLDEEHEVLRRIVQPIADGDAVDGAEVPAALAEAVRKRVRHWRSQSDWLSTADRLRLANNRIRELEEQLAEFVHPDGRTRRRRKA